ncbi:unnamed protein product, partial [Rotaria magnacalcarata]
NASGRALIIPTKLKSSTLN